jgi:ZIP family zinc transporter
MIALLITFLAGISVMIGALIIRVMHDTERLEHFSMAMALGALASLLVFDLYSDLQKEVEPVFGLWLTLAFIAAGVILLAVLDKLSPDHAHHEDTPETHDHENAEHIGLIAAAALLIHNFVEGMSVYSVSMMEPRDGLLFAIGISLHNIPVGMLIYSALRESHRGRYEKAVVLGLVTIATFLGGLAMFEISPLMTEQFVGFLLCVATGMIVYIVFEELIPHIIKTNDKVMNITGLVIGFALVYVSSLIG